jgi:hypothetical protein
MKKFFTWLWEGIKRQFMMFIVSTWYVWIAVILAILTGLIFGWHISIWVFFGGVGAVIAYVFLRQIYWWFTGKVDYEGRGFPKLWNKIFKK